jgi:hypothetical protein
MVDDGLRRAASERLRILSSSASPGPWLLVAAFCDRVLDDGEGNLSLDRLIGRLTLVPEDPSAPNVMPELSHTLTFVLTILTPPGRTSAPLVLGIRSPDGQLRVGPPINFKFTTETPASTLVMPFQMTFHVEGLHLVEVVLDDKLITRIPLDVVYLPQKRSTNPPALESQEADPPPMSRPQ